MPPDAPRYLTGLNSPNNTAKRHYHVWADYIELLCLFHPDREVSDADIADKLKEESDTNDELRENLGATLESEDNLGQDEDIDEGDRENPAQEDDQLAQTINDWFRNLQYREQAFKTFYPFRVSADRNVLRAKSRLSLGHELYIFFLFASYLRCISKKYAGEFTGSFEILSKESLKLLLPDRAEVHLFGSSNAIEPGRYDKGNLWQRASRLANDLNEKIRAEVQAELTGRRAGDGGLDIVAWVPLGDENANMLVVFGQCACTENWVSKKHSSSWGQWKTIMDLQTPTNNVAFIPFCFRSASGSWHQVLDVGDVILMDRLRFIKLLAKKANLLQALPAYPIIQSLLKEKEPLV